MVTAGEYFARALAAKDSAALCALLADPVDFQALTPGRHWQATTGREVAEEIIFEHWFGAGAHILELCSVSTGQGIRLLFAGGARIVYRLSGTGTAGATLRVYLERFEPDPARHGVTPGEALAGLAALSAFLADTTGIVGRSQPSVVA